MSAVLLISRSHEYELRLTTLLGTGVTSVLIPSFSAEELPDTSDHSPDFVFVGPYLSFELANDLCQALRERFPTARLVLVHENKTAIDSLLRDLGADAVISPTATDREVIELVEGPSRVIAVVSPKGGLGKTTVATNLAFGLAKVARESVVLVDADVQFGDVATVLGLDPVHTLPDMVSGLAPRDTMVLKTFLTPHPAGFYIVGGADSPADGDRVSGDQLAHLIEQLSDIFRYVIVDTTPGLGEHALTAIENATDGVMLCSMGVPNLRALRKEIGVLTAIGLMPAMNHIVLNLADKTSGLNRHDAEETIGARVDVMIPRSKAVPLSTNRGVPILEEAPRDPASKSLMQLVARVSSGRQSGRVLTKGVA